MGKNHTADPNLVNASADLDPVIFLNANSVSEPGRDAFFTFIGDIQLSGDDPSLFQMLNLVIFHLVDLVSMPGSTYSPSDQNIL